LEYEMVLADGRFIKVNSTENSDLMFGMKGCGYNFGVVIALTLQAYTIEEVYTGLLMFPFAIATKVLETFRDFSKKYRTDRDVSLLGACGHSPQGDKIIAFNIVLFDSYANEGKGKEILKPFLELGAIMNTLKMDVYKNTQKAIDMLAPHGLCYYENSVFTNASKGFEEEVISSIIKDFTEMPKQLHPLTAIILMDCSEINPKSNEETSFAFRKERVWWITPIAAWSPEPDNTKYDILRNSARDWSRSVVHHVHNHTVGTYTNGTNSDYTFEVVGKSMYMSNMEKLVVLKRKYDPKNFFHHNNNIKP